MAPDDAHLATVSRLTQIEARRRDDRRRSQRRLLRLRVAGLLIGAGVRLGGAPTVDRRIGVPAPDLPV